MDKNERDPASCLEDLWQNHFLGVLRANPIEICYQYPWKNRLATISLTKDLKTSVIKLNKLLQYPEIPFMVLQLAIAHELCHYVHGFGSTLPRCYGHPHANGVVDKELERRGLGELLHEAEAWIDEHWYDTYHVLRLIR